MKKDHSVYRFVIAEEKHLSIFENSSISSQFRLKENIQFHLYISKGPCGDATAFRKEGSMHPDW